jgi:sortase A
MVALGAVMLSYVGVEYSRMYLGQRKLAREWRRQQQLANWSEQPQPVQGGLTRISIPKINLDAIVAEGTTRHDLLLGPGHMLKTPEPGEFGNAVITGHRDTFFRHLHELEKGDVITVLRDGKSYRYEVTAKKIVAAADVSVIQAAKSSRLTLITCYPTYYIGPAPDRLVVFTQRVSEPNEVAVIKTTHESASAGDANRADFLRVGKARK